MAHEFPPVVENWYEDANGQAFAVVAMDEDDGLIEIQYFDGEIEELEMDGWYQLDLTPIEPPEDWTGPFDDLDDEDIDDSDFPAGRGWQDTEDEIDFDE